MVDDDQRVRNLESALAEAQATHRATLSEVNRLATSIEKLATTLRTLKKQFNEFVKEDRLARNMQFAQTALIDIRAQRDRQFGHYTTVRRGTIGMLQAMDAGIVTESALRQAAERLMIDTPGYWLAPAQVALAAWISDSEKLAKRALQEAVAREPNKSALFFSLVLTRHERYKATAKWMHEYVSRQDPMALSREFTVVLDAAAQGALGDRAAQLVKERCVSWYEQLRAAEDVVQEQSLRWLRRMSKNQIKLAERFHVLPRMCPDWDGVIQWLEESTVHGQTERWLRAKLEVTVIPQHGLRQRVDGVLRNLVTAYDEDEDSLRHQEMKWARVVESGGNHAVAAEMQEDDSAADEPRADFLTLLTTIGLTPEKAGASLTTQQFAIRLANEWIVSAAHDLSAKSRSERPQSVSVKIGDWGGVLSSGGDVGDATDKFSRFVDRQVRDDVGRVTTRVPSGALASSVLVFIFILASFSLRWFAPDLTLSSGSVAIAFSLASFIWLRRAQRVLPLRREEVRKMGEERKIAGIADLKNAASEVKEIFELWRAELAKEGALADFICDQASQADPLSRPAIETPGRRAAPAVAMPPAAALPENMAGRSQFPLGEEQSFAFKLPDWDLLPPDHANGPVN